ncbi:RNA polymerase sigma-70 factor [Flammeovirga pacifica]|uniref:RNA polymerase sigma-70 factor n=1 Tax=Flammeovirga pacifica TaxID=915059 RepID=A0A1S1YSH9_FLAPC|nr:RNA polymerase sigma-70 factor [Flammeovirga pacifica]OHX63823.1 hypothetical protein NH26_19620 [Flammeovirga pacifica]
MTENELELLFKTHYKMLCLFCCRIIKDEDTARDIVQECFIKFWDKFEEIDSPEFGKSYLYTLVRNKSLDYLKSLRVSKTIPLTENIDAMEQFYSSLEYSDLERKYLSALDELPEKCKTIFLKSRDEQLSNKEIATQLNLSVKTVEGHITKAIKHLKLALK